MSFTSMACPQCAAPLPRQARWRTVTCPYCSAVVTRSEDIVHASKFHDAYSRAQSAIESAKRVVQLHGARYRLLSLLRKGRYSEVFLGEKMDLHPERVMIKIALDEAPVGRLMQEAKTLKALQTSEAANAAYFTLRLPQVVSVGKTQGALTLKEVLILRHPSGFWGSLAEVVQNYPNGVNPRHIVWMWRRVLEMLSFIHAEKFTHGNVSCENLLVYPREHRILLVGWSMAEKHACADVHFVRQKMRDLQQVAWSMRALLCGGANAHQAPVIPATVPAPLAQLLLRCSTEVSWCSQQSAASIHDALVDAARQSFGEPKFVVFSPDPR